MFYSNYIVTLQYCNKNIKIVGLSFNVFIPWAAYEYGSRKQLLLFWFKITILTCFSIPLWIHFLEQWIINQLTLIVRRYVYSILKNDRNLISHNFIEKSIIWKAVRHMNDQIANRQWVNLSWIVIWTFRFSHLRWIVNSNILQLITIYIYFFNL